MNFIITETIGTADIAKSTGLHGTVLHSLCTVDLSHTSGGSRISRRGGVDLVGGAVDPRGGYISKILHVKMKESGPVGGARAERAPP